MPSSMIPRHFHLSHRSIKTRFAYRFLRALKKLNKPMIRNTCIHHTTTRSRRYHMVKTAAYASMAAAVGTKRAWSRALLWKIRNRGRTTIHHHHHHHVVATKRSKLGPRGGSVISSKKIISMNKENPSNKATGQLQKLVPGGEVMDFCSLLDETAHYIKCLTSQVQIMRSIVDFYSV